MDNQTDNLYQADFLIWAERQVELLRSRQFDQLDLHHLTEEIADMGSQLRHELRHRLELLILHLLKFAYQPQRVSNSWRATIREQRRRIELLLDDAPSLAPRLDQILDTCYRQACLRAVQETGLPASTFPATNPFSREQLLDPVFLPPLLTDP